MIGIILMIALIVVAPSLFRRYFPLVNIPCVKREGENTNVFALDIRDYNEREYENQEISLHIPYAYLKRNTADITSKNLHIIAADRLEVNLGVRYLLKKGFNVVSYEISNCPCKKKEVTASAVR